MKRNARSVLFGALGALGVVVLAGLWAIAAASFEPVRRLPDGSTLALESVSYGKLHPDIHGCWWQKRLYPLLSPKIRNWSGLWALGTGWMEGTYISHQADTLVLHATRRGVAGRVQEPLRAVALGPDGAEFASGMEGGGLFVRGPGQVAEAWELPVFPRRERSIPVRVYEHFPRDRWLPVAQFVVANPVFRRYPVWAPQPLPILKQAGDLAVTLTAVATGPMPGGPFGPSPPGADTWTRLSFRMAQQDRPTTAWRPVAVTVSDATGNVWTHRNERFPAPASPTDLQFSGGLPPSEKAWKLRVELSQATGFDSGDLWSVKGVPIPKRDQLLDSAATLRRQGMELSLSLSGAGDPLRRGPHWRQPFPTVAVTTSPSLPGLQLTLLRATDDRGRPVYVFGGHAASMGGGEYHYYLDGVAPGAKQMNLLFALHRNRMMEFLVAPPGARPPARG